MEEEEAGKIPLPPPKKPGSNLTLTAEGTNTFHKQTKLAALSIFIVGRILQSLYQTGYAGFKFLFEHLENKWGSASDKL